MRILSSGSYLSLRRGLRALTLLALASGALGAQDVVIRQAVINPKTKQPETVRSALSTQKPLAVTADGRWWTAVYWNDGSYTTGSSFTVFDKARHLLLMVSSDGGATWSQATQVRTTGAVYGSLVTDPDGHTLHVVWYAMNGKGRISGTKIYGYYSIFYSTYDTRTGKWAGTKDEEIVPGWDSNHSWSLPDIAVTPHGVVGVTFNCGRGVPKNWVGTTRSWSGGFLWKKNGKWSKPHQLNVDYTGVRANIQAYGETFHMVYRTATGGYGICYRTFDAVTEKFGPETPIVPDPNNPSRNIRNLYANNVAQVGILPGGDVLVLYATGTSNTGGGKLRYLIKPAGSSKFGKPMVIDDDPRMGWGNNTYWCYTLVRNGKGLAAVYSKKTETYQNLYMRTLTPAGPVPPYGKPAIPLRKGSAKDMFHIVSGFREPGVSAGMRLVYTDYHAIGPLTGGRAMFLGTPTGAALRKGPGCAGSLSRTPDLWVSGTPALNSTLTFELSRHPANAAGILLMGIDDAKFLGLPLPFDLTPLGMKGCSLYQDIRFSLTYTTGAQGSGTAGIQIPSTPSMAGFPFFWQGIVVAPGANTPGLLLTNGICTIFR